ncbi:CsbD family protein [soil metagenome]
MSTESKFDDAKGRTKEAAGDFTGNDDMKREGKADQAGASVKEKLDNAKDKAGDMIDKAKDAVTSDDK